MATITDDKEREAYERVERKFNSGNSIDVERTVITKEEWDLSKKFIASQAYDK